MDKKFPDYKTWVPKIFVNYAIKKRKSFYSLEAAYDKAQIRKPFELFLAALIFYYLILTMFCLFFILYVFSSGFTTFNINNFFLAIGLFFVLSPLSFLMLYHYPHVRSSLLIMRLDPEIKKVAKLFLEELDKNNRAYEIFIKLSNSKLKTSAKEFEYIINMVENDKKKFIEAIVIAASETPSDKFREFLYDLNLSIRSERELRRVLNKYVTK